MSSTPLPGPSDAIREAVRRSAPGSVLVSAALDHAPVIESFWREERASVTVLSLDDGLDYLLERTGRSFASLQRLVPLDAYADIDRLAEEMGNAWHLCRGCDVTEFECVSYASFVQWELTYFFARVMKSVVDAEAVAGAGLSDAVVILERSGLDPMLPYRRRDLMGDQPEALFANALAYVGGGLTVHRVALPGTPAGGPRRWRARLSQSIQRWSLPPLLRWTRRRRVYVQDAYYLGSDLLKALMEGARYQLVDESTVELTESLRGLRGRAPLHTPPAWFGRRAASEAARRAEAHFAGSAQERLRDVLGTGVLRFRGVDLGPLVRSRLDFLFSRRFPELAADQARIRAWIEATGICASVLAEDVMQWSRQLIAAGRTLGMKSLCVQHGATGYRDLGPWNGFVPVAADVTAVWGEISRDWMARAGVAPERLPVVGPTRFDSYPQTGCPATSTEVRRAFCARAGLPSGARVILYVESAAQPYLYPNVHYAFRHTRRNLEMVLSAIRRLPGFCLAIRLRNGDADPYAALYRDLIDRQGGPAIRILPDMPLPELLLHAEFAIVSYSGVSIEALYYDHPVIVIDATGYHRVIPVVEYGAGVLAHSAEDLSAFIKRHDTDPALRAALARGRARLLEEYVVARDGGASRRVAALLDALVEQGPAAVRAAG